VAGELKILTGKVDEQREVLAKEFERAARIVRETKRVTAIGFVVVYQQSAGAGAIIGRGGGDTIGLLGGVEFLAKAVRDSGVYDSGPDVPNAPGPEGIDDEGTSKPR
jgi:hypothetical protein